MNPVEIDWIFFDVGGVLLDDTKAEQRRTQLLLDICLKHDPSLRTEDVLHARRVASAKIGPLETNVIEFVLHDPVQQQIALEEVNRRSEEIGYVQNSSLRPEAIEVTEQLSKKYKLGIMANQPEQTRRRLEEYGLLHHFHHTGMSGSYGFHKPDPRLFKEIFKEIGANPERSVMIDDNIERGLVPAKALGMKTIWYKRESGGSETHPAADMIIESLTELPDLL